MSWMKRPQSGGAPPDQQRYAAPQVQPFGNQQNMYTNYPPSNTGAVPQQQYWPAPPQQQPQYNQQYGQVYQQVDYRSNANQYYQLQPTQYGQTTFPSQSHGNNVPQGYQQNYYPNQSVQEQNYSQNKGNTDGWDDNWDWGWEDSTKAHKEGGQLTIPHMTQQVPNQAPQQMYNNANVIEESFGTTDSWNWSMEEKQGSKNVPPANAHEKDQPATLDVSSHLDSNLGDVVTMDSTQQMSTNTPLQPVTEDVKTLNDKEVVKERMPNLALGKRFHLDNLTPQWSIESQMSQDSSDGPLTQSEGGTFRSELQSRNSDKSNYSQHSLDEPYQNPDWSRFSAEEPALADNSQSGSCKVESHADITSSMQEMSIANNENPTSDRLPLIRESNSRNSHEQVATVVQPLLAPSPSNLPASIPVHQVSSSTSTMPAPSVSPATLPPPPSSSAVTAPPLAPHPTSGTLLPPSNFPPTMTSQNPFKHAGPFSHKSSTKVGSSSNLSSQPFPPSMSNASLTSPSVVSKVPQQGRVPAGYGANLETTPDNSERPDQPQMLAFRPLPVAHQVPENLEVAPKNDRNEYLQTAHLSSGDYGENTDFSNIPPPGLRRMVVGQQESEYSQSLNMSGDEPPPGFARMVPGQQNEAETSYNQPSDNYLDRHIDGQPTDNSGHPYRQADGQQTPDNYTQTAPSRGGDRRPIGLDRMVPGEPSNDEYSQYQASSYAASNEQRVVMGVDHDFNIPVDAGPSDVREQNVDGSDYTIQTPRNAARNIISIRESNKDASSDFNAAPEDEQREVVMEGENLQDLSIISTELTFTREHALDGADVNVTDASVDRKTDASDSMDLPAPGSRRQSLNQTINTSGDDSERDRLFKSSPRRDKHRSSKDRDRDRDKEGRYSRGDRKYEREPERRVGRDREERWPDKERRDRDRDYSPDGRRHRRHRRYDTEDTDYYSDRERERRRYREGSYSSKPPRPDDKERRRYDTVERERSRRYEGERRSERRYRDIDPSRKRGNLQRERDEDERRRVVTFSRDAKASDSGRTEGSGPGPGPGSPGRASSREPRGTDDERERRRTDSYRRGRHARNYYDGYAETDPYLVQRQQYQYYEHLRHTDPAAYMEVYKQLMAGRQPPPPPPGYLTKGFVSLSEHRDRAEERGSVHSGRSSANDLKGHDTFYYLGARAAAGGAGSLRTDGSDRDLTTDASLNLHLEESTVRSERMTPCKFSTAHIKGSMSSRNVVVVRPSYPVDGLPATVHVLSLASALRAARDPAALELHGYPGPLLKGVTHKKSVVEYCLRRARAAARTARDPLGAALLWDLLALLLRQNGVVVGTDIAELLMKNKREYEDNAGYELSGEAEAEAAGGRRQSSMSGSGRDEAAPPAHPELAPAAADLTGPECSNGSRAPAGDEAALDQLRELLIYGNRQEAIEWAMSCGLWGHALQLSAYSGRRARAAVAQRFVARLPRRDPLHTLYAALQARLPPAATCVSEERWADWRPHAAIVLANSSTSPDQDRRTLLQLGDSLASRGLVYSAQFCYISGGEPFSRHPLAPLAADAPAAGPAAGAAPRLSLLLADPRAGSLAQLATNEAIFATEIYEYAMSLNQEYVIEELQVYKLVLASRLCDAGEYERALAYGEQAARTVLLAPARYSPRLLRALADLADRLKYHDPALAEDAPAADDSGEPSPAHRPQPQPHPHPHPHQWLDDVKLAAELARLQHTAAAHTWERPPPEPQPEPPSQPPQHATPAHHTDYYDQQAQRQYGWTEQAQPPFAPPPAACAEPPPPADDAPDYSAHYYQPPPAGDDQPATYWPQEHYHYAEVPAPAATGADGAASSEPRPMITMPGGGGSGGSKPALYADYDDDRPPSADPPERDSDTPRAHGKADRSKEEPLAGREGREGKEGRRGGWLGGLFTKLSLRPPNQMILPDDKNPTIVWDEQNKRWRNTDADADDAGADRGPPPPPPAAHLPRSGSPPLAGAPPAAPLSNIFKMQKGRHIKNSYVDVLNPGAARGAAPAPLAAPLTAPLAAPPAYFVPAPLPHQVIELPPPPAPSATTPQSGVYEDAPPADEYEQYRSGI